MGAPLGPKYVPYAYIDPLGIPVRRFHIDFIEPPNRFRGVKFGLRYGESDV